MDITLTPTPSESQPATVTPGEGSAYTNQGGERVDIPTENDVLCGRGGSINSHTGNENFRNLVEKRKRVYLTARFKREKRLIASSIVSEIRAMNPPGRFLAKKGGKDGYWYDIGDEKARDKTSQALRENAPTIRAEIETEINHQRQEMKRREDEEQHSVAKSAYATNGGTYPIPHNPYNYPQQAMDYYYSYYGYGRPPPPPQAHGAPLTPSPPIQPAPMQSPAAAVAAAPPPSYPTSPPPQTSPQNGFGWAALPHLTPRTTLSHEEFKEDDCPPSHAVASRSQEDDDRQFAMDLQFQENMDAFEDRKRRYHEDPTTRRTGRSGSFVPIGEQPPQAYHGDAYHKCPKVAKTAFSFASMKMDDTERTQEEEDHRLAVALQEQEDNAVRSQREASSHEIRRTSRSNAYSQVRRFNLGGYDVPSSVFAWTKSSSDKDKQYKKVPQEHQPPETLSEHARPVLSRRRSVQFKDDEIDNSARSGSMSRSNGFAPFNFSRENSLVSDRSDPKNGQIQPRSGHREVNGQDSSFMTQVANQILGSLGSWDTNVCAHDSAGTPQNGFPPERRSPDPRDTMNANHIQGGAQASPSRRDPAFETEGHEVSLTEVRDEMSMPPPEPRVQIDWPSRVGSCYTFFPEAIGAGAASFFGAASATAATLGPSTNHPPQNRRGSAGSYYGVSPVHSLDMDNSEGVSGNMSCTGSIGGGSLCQVFDNAPNPGLQDGMMLPSPMNHRMLQQVPSWERSMRSKSPVSLGSVDSDDSMIRVRRLDKGDKTHSRRGSASSGTVQRHAEENYTTAMASETAPVNHNMMDWEDSSQHHPE